MSDLVKYNQNDILVAEAKKDKNAEYLELVLFILDMVKIDTNQPALDDKMLKAMSQSWKGHFDRRKIPARVLLELYHDAIDFRAQEQKWSAFSVEDMLAAWFRHQETMANIIKPQGSAKDCDQCHGSYRVRFGSQDGRQIEVECPNH